MYYLIRNIHLSKRECYQHTIGANTKSWAEEAHPMKGASFRKFFFNKRNKFQIGRSSVLILDRAICLFNNIIGALLRTDRVLSNFADVLLHSGTGRIVGILAGIFGFAAIILTVMQIRIDLQDRSEERIDRAWSKLLTVAPGNTGKGGSFSYLVGVGVGLDRVDLSCRQVGNFDAVSNICVKPVVFDRIDFSIDSAATALHEIQGLDLSDAVVGRLRLTSKKAIDWIANRADIQMIDLKDSFAKIDLNNAKTNNCRINGTLLIYNGRMLIDGKCNISGSFIVGSSDSYLEPSVDVDHDPIFGGSYIWAWADQPPYFLVPGNGASRVFYPIAEDNSPPFKVELCTPQESGDRTDHLLGIAFCNPMSFKEARDRYPGAYFPHSLDEVAKRYDIVGGRRKLETYFPL